MKFKSLLIVRVSSRSAHLVIASLFLFCFLPFPEKEKGEKKQEMAITDQMSTPSTGY